MERVQDTPEAVTSPAAGTTGPRTEYGKPKPRGLMRLFLRVPPFLYRIGLGGALGDRLLVLTTTGRRTGRPRTVGLNYARDGRTLYLISGYGRTDWFRNVLAHPRVRVQVGTDAWPGEARLVVDPSEELRARDLFAVQAISQGPPAPLRPLFRRLGLDYEAEVARLRDPDLAFPIIALAPVPPPEDAPARDPDAIG
jgi:deazaflavin-dependent oxidoreductase (nitroreductase family)